MSDEKNIGILVVHGIGDQKQFDCLKGAAQSIVDYLQSEINSGYVEVSLDINRATTGTFQSLHPPWQDGKEAPINLRIKPTGRDSEIYNLHFREVWWADLDRPQNFFKFLEFWFWGLGLWAIPAQDHNLPILNDPENDLNDLSWDENQGDRNYKKIISRLLARLEYALIGLFLIICQPILFVLKTVLRLLDWDVPLTIIADYVGKLRLYQRPANSGQDLIEDFGNPPRFSIQRRMINALVRMAISDYDRWYVWSHSLGSIVAYNAFSMPEATLSHYVSRSMWEEIEEWDFKQLLIVNLYVLLIRNGLYQFGSLLLRQDQRLYQDDPFHKKLLRDLDTNESNTGRPKPYRPVWQTKKISRKSLFAKCEGLLTYGSPFWRIADLWPDLVKRNTEADFQLNFNWYNVIDPSDPVATRIKELFSGHSHSQFNTTTHKSLYPEDVFHRTPLSFLFAHLSYLSSSKKDSLISQLWRWVSEDKKISQNNDNLYGGSPLRYFWQHLQENTNTFKKFYLLYHQVWRYIWWFVLIIVSYLVLDLIWVVLTPIFQDISTFLTSIPDILRNHFFNDYSDSLISKLASCLMHLGDNYDSVMQGDLGDNYDFVIEKIGNLIFNITNIISKILPNPYLFLICLGLLIISGLILSIRGNPIKSYLLEYLQDNPNEPFSPEQLREDVFPNIRLVTITKLL
ncbi:MAG: hypothetical protein QNJ41_11960 [Xenococcaceae cyanobacterium MO_188.B32]|nr:hypothetical protein [Xenococcaceae cyanobacterium MO_188.B32]